MNQHTLRHSFSLSGKGLHTGLMVTAAFSPSDAGTGIRICRTDLPGQPMFEALADYVAATERATVLANGEWQVSTVEHAMSALYALGVNNCLIEVDAPEMPILDGSAMPFVQAIQQAGIDEQEKEQNVFVVTKPLSFTNEQGNRLTLLPSDHFEVEVEVEYPSEVLRRQQACLRTMDDYTNEIASARTFCFLREIEPLLRAGLIKGGDLQNALVIYDTPVSQECLNEMADQLGQPRLDASRLGYLSSLKYPNEPARHKLLDLMGDIALLGRPIQGKLVATHPGHSFNAYCCRQLRNLIIQ